MELQFSLDPKEDKAKQYEDAITLQFSEIVLGLDMIGCERTNSYGISQGLTFVHPAEVKRPE